MQFGTSNSEILIELSNEYIKYSDIRYENLIQCEVCNKMVVSRQRINNKFACVQCYTPIQKAYVTLEY